MCTNPYGWTKYMSEQILRDTAFADEPMSAEDKDTVIHYIKCACFGMVIDWMNCGMNDSTRKKLLRICELKKGMAAELIRRSARN